jgi:hypothetical protein
VLIGVLFAIQKLWLLLTVAIYRAYGANLLMSRLMVDDCSKPKSYRQRNDNKNGGTRKNIHSKPVGFASPHTLAQPPYGKFLLLPNEALPRQGR